MQEFSVSYDFKGENYSENEKKKPSGNDKVKFQKEKQMNKQHFSQATGVVNADQLKENQLIKQRMEEMWNVIFEMQEHLKNLERAKIIEGKQHDVKKKTS